MVLSALSHEKEREWYWGLNRERRIVKFKLVAGESWAHPRWDEGLYGANSSPDWATWNEPVWLTDWLTHASGSDATTCCQAQMGNVTRGLLSLLSSTSMNIFQMLGWPFCQDWRSGVKSGVIVVRQCLISPCCFHQKTYGLTWRSGSRSHSQDALRCMGTGPFTGLLQACFGWGCCCNRGQLYISLWWAWSLAFSRLPSLEAQRMDASPQS